MRVGLLTDAFARDTRFGLGRYAHELRAGLITSGVEVVPGSSVSQYGDAPPSWLQETGFRRFPIDRKWLAATWSFFPEPRIERWLGSAIDLVHSVDTDYAVATKKPWVITFHDLGVVTHPEYFGKARPWLMRRCVEAAADRAAAIICVSNSTAAEVVAAGGDRVIDRVHVIPEGVGTEFFASVPPDTSLPDWVRTEPFFLFTGSISPRKNLLRVLEAFELIAPLVPHRLILTGAPGWDTKVELDRVATGPWGNRLLNLGYVSDVTLRLLYKTAGAFLYPSLYEGFGLPILEAMASDCPVITSNISPFVDVAGDAAIFVNPKDCEAIAAAMLRVTDPEVADSLRTRGKNNALQYRWTACVEKTMAVYRSVV